METFYLYWAPEGKLIAVVTAKDASSARNKLPRGYRRYKGEISVRRVETVARKGLYKITTFDDGEILVTSSVTGAWVDTWSHGAWHDTGRLPDDIRAFTGKE